MISHGDCLSLAPQSCTKCLGLGKCSSRGKSLRVCACVYRAIFRCCFEKFKSVANNDLLGRVDRMRSNASYGMTRAEFSADFLLIAKRELTELEYRVFKFHFLYGAELPLACRKVGLDPNNRSAWHIVYRIEEKLGRAFSGTQPHALYPIDAYFAGVVRTQEHPLLKLSEPELPAPTTRSTRFPLALAARKAAEAA